MDKKKKFIFNILMFLIPLIFIFLVEFIGTKYVLHQKSQLVLLEKERQIKRLNEDFEYNDKGWRIVDSFESIDYFKKILIDSQNLNDNGIFVFPDYRILNKDKFYFTIRINKQGFRGPDWDVKKATNEKRVFLLGGSTSFSMFADEENSIHNQLELRLNETNIQKDIKYKVFSAGIPGMLAAEEYGTLLLKVMDYKPDIIIVMNGFNDASVYDLQDGQNTSLDEFYNSERKINIFSRIVSIEFEKYSRFFDFLIKKMSYFFINKIEKSRGGIKEYITNMNQMKDFLEKKELPLLVFLQPTPLVNSGRPLSRLERNVRELWRNNQKDIFYNYNKSYLAIDKFLAEKNFHYIDGRNLSKYGLYTGVLNGNEKRKIKDASLYSQDDFILKKIRMEMNDKNQKYDAGALFLNREKNKKEVKLLEGIKCSKIDATVIHSGEYNYNCFIGKTDILDLSKKKDNWSKGYLDTPYQTSENNELSFSLHLPFKIQKIELEVNTMNYRDRDNVTVELLVSQGMNDYISLGKKTEAVGQDSNTWNYKPNNVNGNFRYKIRLNRSDFYVGIESINLKITGISNSPLWNIGDETLEVNNRTLTHFDIESFRLIEQPNIFVDAAHLDFHANKSVAEEMAKYILLKKW